MKNSTERFNETIVRGLDKLRTKGKNIFIIMFMLACMGVACDIILVFTAAQWTTIAHMNDKQLSMVMALDLGIIGVVLALSFFAGRWLWRRMEEKYVSLTCSKPRPSVRLGGPPGEHEKN